MLAGHSLGGALATLAAYDICKQLEQAGRQDVKVLCYSFGAPRIGNRAFAKDYNRVVPDTWSIINERVRLQLLCNLSLARSSLACSLDKSGEACTSRINLMVAVPRNAMCM